MEINERIANFIVSLGIINSLNLYFIGKDFLLNNKNINNIFKKLEL